MQDQQPPQLNTDALRSVLQQLPQQQVPQVTPDSINQALQMFQSPQRGQGQGQGQQTILPGQTQITQQFGNYNPGLEVFSGGHALDTNFAADEGTPVALPPGKWQVVNLNNSASTDGKPGNGENAGYGRAVLAQNLDTGERLHFIHLSDVGVGLGDTLQGGAVIGKTGHSGNATGPNLGLEYYDPNGQLGDIMGSNYSKYFNLQ